MDRAFKTDYDFNKHIGKACDIKFYAPQNGCKEWLATLVAFDDNALTVEYNKNSEVIDRKLIASISAHIEF